MPKSLSKRSFSDDSAMAVCLMRRWRACQAAVADTALITVRQTANETIRRAARRACATSAKDPIVADAYAIDLIFPRLRCRSSQPAVASAGQPQLTGAQGNNVARGEAEARQPRIVHGREVAEDAPLRLVLAGRKQPLDKA
jgi:hypothetical protein